MKKLLLICLLMPLLAQAAQWVKVGSDVGSEAFIDKSSILRSGSQFKVWSLCFLICLFITCLSDPIFQRFSCIIVIVRDYLKIRLHVSSYNFRSSSSLGNGAFIISLHLSCILSKYGFLSFFNSDVFMSEYQNIVLRVIS